MEISSYNELLCVDGDVQLSMIGIIKKHLPITNDCQGMTHLSVICLLVKRDVYEDNLKYCNLVNTT